MLNRDESLKICETLLAHAKAAGAEDAAVSVESSVESHARFADNRITTSGRADDLGITATVWVGKRRGAATGNDSSANALKQLADEAVQIARVSPVHREYVPTLGPLTYPDDRGFAPTTADSTTPACSFNTRSTSSGKTFSPSGVTIISFLRPRMNRRPCASFSPTSPVCSQPASSIVRPVVSPALPEGAEADS